MKPLANKDIDEALVKAARAETGWSDTRVAALRHLHGLGLSCAQIAKQMGGATRCGVIGKLHRLGLSNRRKPSEPRQRTTYSKPEPKPRATVALKIAGNGAVFVEPDARPPQFQTKFREGEGGLRIIDPGFDGCRWPLNGEGADMRFCCGKRPDGDTYCEDHARAAYTPTMLTPKRRANELVRSLRRYA